MLRLVPRMSKVLWMSQVQGEIETYMVVAQSKRKTQILEFQVNQSNFTKGKMTGSNSSLALYNLEGYTHSNIISTTRNSKRVSNEIPYK